MIKCGASYPLAISSFEAGFKAFLEQESLQYEDCGNGLVRFASNGLLVQLVPAGVTPEYVGDGRKYLYEDLWRKKNDLMRKRILSHNGRFVSVFARKCSVTVLDNSRSNEFLDRCHSYGAARSKYRYGLEYGGQLVAVATFSRARLMYREVPVLSSEWIRYASLPDMRVVGGMGRLMNAFVKDVHPQEIMSYCDLEWSDGQVYRTLGFEEAARRAPVDFFVDTRTWQRISVSKLSSDRAYRNMEISPDSFVRISNLGSVKYLKRF